MIDTILNNNPKIPGIRYHMIYCRSALNVADIRTLLKNYANMKILNRLGISSIYSAIYVSDIDDRFILYKKYRAHDIIYVYNNEYYIIIDNKMNSNSEFIIKSNYGKVIYDIDILQSKLKYNIHGLASYEIIVTNDPILYSNIIYTNNSVNICIYGRNSNIIIKDDTYLPDKNILAMLENRIAKLRMII